MVVGLNLCPFAKSVVRAGQLKLVVCEDSRLQDCLQQFADEAAALASGDPRSTVLFILAQGYDEFDDYLDLLATADALLDDMNLRGILQLASFHPRYQFDGTGIDEVTNWTNRAPYPILHLLTESSVEQAVDRHSDPQSIPEKNIKRLKALGLEAILEIVHSK